MSEIEAIEAVKNATIMMVDDEPTTLEVVEMFLQGEGYSNLVTTTDPTKAVDLFMESRPDLLLLDLIMPKVSGLEILGKIRKDRTFKHVPIIILTSSTDAKTRIKALEIGATDFLSKPVDASELALRLRNTLTGKAYQDRLALYHMELERKVEERTAELNVMRVAAERASQAKSHFLANMSHEIRTPMTAITGYTEVLIEDGRVQKDQREFLDIIKRNGDHLLAIINGILDLSRIESDQMELHESPVDLVRILVEVARAMKVRADEREIELALEFPSPVPTKILSDGVRIRQSVINLVGNAIKFTKEGSVKVRLDYDADNSIARVDVIDTGIGVAPQLIPSLFLQFEQADATTSRQYGGTGLGLAITRRLAQLLGGDCTMESEVGAGTQVSLTFRAQLEEGAEIRAVPEAATRLSEPRPAAAPQRAIHARILLAEDGIDNQKLISRILTKAGAEVVIADNGRVALDILRTDDAFDLVLMDMAMPEMDGYTATRTLRDIGCELPILALTAHALDGEREKCLAAGCDDYATKPVDRAMLVGFVRSALEGRAKAEEQPSSFEDLCYAPEYSAADGVVEPAAPEPESTPSRRRTDAKMAAARSAPSRSRPSGDEDLPQADPLIDIDTQLEVLKNATIMMVDDEETTLDVIEMFLQGEGYTHFVTTTDSTKALDLFAKNSPDVLLLDLVMPDVGGLEILEAIREDEALRHTPVIILTSSTDPPTKLAALELGATDFLAKPVDSSELALRLRNTLSAKEYQDRLAYYDALTSLPNRRLFLERLDRALRRSGAASQKCTILHIGLDRFKQINDTLGHGVGDALLKAVADRLQNCVREPVSRVGGDEFGVLLPRCSDADGGAQVARRVLSSLTEPFCVGDHELFVTCSVGIALFPNDGDEVDTLLKHANVALSHAKRAGQSPIQFYRRSLNAKSEDRLSLESQLRKALDGDELLLHYQPKVDIKSGKIIGAEALLRWQHPELGLLFPDKFIPIAEESDLIGSLSDWALREACRQSMEWIGRGYRPVSLAVNVSSRQFDASRLIETIRGALKESGLNGEFLVLELTERQLMENPQKTSYVLRELKRMGVRLSVDDFGTGYSSLTYLKRFPLHELKIDRSFISGIPGSTEDAAIVAAIIGLSHTLGLSVVAEGVETTEQLEFLKERGCDIYQGFLYAKPSPPSDWEAVFERAGHKTQPNKTQPNRTQPKPQPNKTQPKKTES